MTTLLYIVAAVACVSVIFSAAVAVVAICRVSGQPVDEQYEDRAYIVVKPKVPTDCPRLAEYFRELK